MNERSRHARSTGSGKGWRYRRLVRSITVTRGSVLICSCTWPYPTSTPYTRVAPLCKRQSVNPPVLRPESRATSFSGSISNSSRAFSSFRPPRQTYFGVSAVISIFTSGRSLVPALVTGCPLTSTLPCAIHDWTTLREYSGYSRRASSSSRALAPGFFGLTGSDGVPSWAPRDDDARTAREGHGRPWMTGRADHLASAGYDHLAAQCRAATHALILARFMPRPDPRRREWRWSHRTFHFLPKSG